MHATRTHIGEHCRQAGGKLLLHVEIPLHHVIAFGGRLIIRGTQSVRRKGNILAAKIEKGARTWVEGRATRSRGILDHGVRKEADCLSHQKWKLASPRLHIKHTDSASVCGLSVPQRVPRAAVTQL